jgi:hypothetical protein
MNDPRFEIEPNYKTDYISVPVYDEEGDEISRENVWYEYYIYRNELIVTNHSLNKALREDFYFALDHEHSETITIEL